jgi:anti-sigma factor RsiW
MCDFSTKLINWHDGELPEDEALAVEHHVHVCSECRDQLDAYEKVGGMVNAYCDATLASQAPVSGLPNWAPVLGAAASIAVLLMLFAQGRAERSPRSRPAVAVPAAPLVAPSIDGMASAPVAVPAPVSRQIMSKQVRRHSIVASAHPQDAQRDTSWQASEPAIQIAIPGEATFPPGALPLGIDFVADVSIAADGSAQRLRLQPRLTGFEGGSNQ